MIIAYHVIISAYGFWLPNEERGSWSDFVRDWELFRDYGSATKVNTTRSVARAPCDWSRRTEARRSLIYPPVTFNGVQARAIARGFAQRADRSDYQILACAILREHAHLVIARHRYHVEKVINLLKGAASTQLVEEEIHPFQNVLDDRYRRPSPWGQGFWKVYLESDSDVERSVRYVQRNPVKDRLPAQNWWFVKSYSRANRHGPADRR